MVNSLKRQWSHHVGVPAGQHVQRGKSSLRFGGGDGAGGGGGGDGGKAFGGGDGGGVGGNGGGVVAVGVRGGFSVQENLLYT